METQPSVKRYVRAIGKRWWLLVLMVIIAASGVYYRYGEVTPTYGASALLMVTRPPMETSWRNTVMNDVQDLIGIRPIGNRVARRLNTSLDRVQKGTSSHILRDSALIRIRATATHPDMASAMANTTAEELVKYFEEINTRNARQTRRFVEAQVNEVRSRLAAIDNAVLGLRRFMAPFAGPQGSLVSQYFSALSVLREARVAARETEARLATAKARFQQEEPIQLSERLTQNNPVFQQYQSRLAELELERAQLSQLFTSMHPKMQQIEAELLHVRGLLSAQAETIVREVDAANPVHTRLLLDLVTLQIEHNAVNAKVAAIEESARSLRPIVEKVPVLEGRLARLAREQSILEDDYRALSGKLREARIEENVAKFLPAGIQVAERAVAPSRPTPTPLTRTAAAAGFAGLILGAIAALVLDAGDPGRRTVEEEERTLGVPVLASVPNANQPRVAPANALFATFFILLFSLSLLSAYTPTRFAAVNFSGRVLRALVIQPLQPLVGQTGQRMRALWSERAFAMPR